jgi:hypothetical protein
MPYQNIPISMAEFHSKRHLHSLLNLFLRQIGNRKEQSQIRVSASRRVGAVCHRTLVRKWQKLKKNKFMALFSLLSIGMHHRLNSHLRQQTALPIEFYLDSIGPGNNLKNAICHYTQPLTRWLPRLSDDFALRNQKCPKLLVFHSDRRGQLKERTVRVVA